MDFVIDSRIVLRFLMLLVTLAIVSATGESRTPPGSEPIAGAEPAVRFGAIEIPEAPKPPTFFSIARPPGLPVANRTIEHGPPTGGLCASCDRSADPPRLPSSLDPSRLRALARSLLAFAPESAFARTGARSSFGTTLPPPFHASARV